MKFSDIVNKIKEYLGSKSYTPFFVSVGNAEDYKELKSNFQFLPVIRVSDYCREDTLPDYDALYDDLEILNTDSMIIGVGDISKLSGNDNIIGKIKDMILPCKLVVLCRGISFLFDNMCRTDPKFNRLRYCSLSTDYDCIFVKVLPEILLQGMNGIKKTLAKLEEGNNGKFYVSTSMDILSAYEIVSSYEAVMELFPSFSLDQSVLIEEQWCSYLKDQKLEGYPLTHWRTYLQSLIFGTDNEYLNAVVRNSVNYIHYSLLLFNYLFEIPCQTEYYWQMYLLRKKLLQDIDAMDMIVYLSQTEKMGAKRMFYLTDNTVQERRMIIKEIVRTQNIPKELEKIYPSLADYLYDYVFTGEFSQELTEYFSAYKKQKLLNIVDETFKEKVEQLSLSENRIYNQLSPKNKIIEKYDNGSTVLCWIDALGVEYLGYIQRKCVKMNLNAEITIGCASIPTITESNKSFFNSWQGTKMPKEEELDKIKHKGIKDEDSSFFDVPLHLEQELQILDRIFEKILVKLKSGTQDILIVSDHGASRLAVVNNDINIIKMEQRGQYSGRYCVLTENDDLPQTASECDGVVSFANYNRFKGSKKANTEVHGGATLEEVLVPIIHITLKTDIPRAEIELLTKNPQYTHSTDPIVILYCPYQANSLILKIENQIYNGRQTEEHRYEFVLRNFKKRKRKVIAECYEKNSCLKTFEFEVTSKAIKMNKDDDFFS